MIRIKTIIINNGKFVFNEYKTFKQYGKVIIDLKLLAPELNTLIKNGLKLIKQNIFYFHQMETS